MTTKNKILAGLAALGIAGAGFYGVDNACLDKDGITMFPAVELTLRENVEGKDFEVGKICFSKKADYEVFKTDRINSYLAKSKDDRALWLLSEEGQQLDDVLTYEIQKIGTIELPPQKEGDDVFLQIIDKLTN